MATDIRWKASLSATCLHAAMCRRAGIVAANALPGEAIARPADALCQEIGNGGWSVEAVLSQLAALASEYENNRELVTRALARLQIDPVESVVGRVAGAIADLEAALRRVQPEIVEELAVRGRPLMEQWEARGPGMLNQLTRSTDELIVPETAEIVLVAPYAGGHGVAHAAVNRVTFEAVLVNPHAELPETVRLAWLLGQLNSDLPRFADALPTGTASGTFGATVFRATVFRAAMLAPALTAGEVVELTRCDEATIEMAVDAWYLRDELPADAATRIWGWWQAWQDRPLKWPVAVAALGEMLR
jgi:hypothetical protein